MKYEFLSKPKNIIQSKMDIIKYYSITNNLLVML